MKVGRSQEGRRRRVFVGQLIYHKKENQYELVYNENYVRSKKAIPIGPGLDLFKTRHISARGILFPSLADRIPSKDNPAYEDYCKSQGIAVHETNPIILLGSIGKRGPSSFIFEPVYKKEFSVETLLNCRKKLHISRHDFAMALDFSETTLQKMETLKSHDPNILKLLQIYFDFPEVALWQLKQTGNTVKNEVLIKLIKYFSKGSDSIVS